MNIHQVPILLLHNLLYQHFSGNKDKREHTNLIECNCYINGNGRKKAGLNMPKVFIKSSWHTRPCHHNVFGAILIGATVTVVDSSALAS